MKLTTPITIRLAGAKLFDTLLLLLDRASVPGCDKVLDLKAERFLRMLLPKTLFFDPVDTLTRNAGNALAIGGAKDGLRAVRASFTDPVFTDSADLEAYFHTVCALHSFQPGSTEGLYRQVFDQFQVRYPTGLPYTATTYNSGGVPPFKKTTRLMNEFAHGRLYWLRGGPEEVQLNPFAPMAKQEPTLVQQPKQPKWSEWSTRNVFVSRFSDVTTAFEELNRTHHRLVARSPGCKTAPYIYDAPAKDCPHLTAIVVSACPQGPNYLVTLVGSPQRFDQIVASWALKPREALAWAYSLSEYVWAATGVRIFPQLDAGAHSVAQSLRKGTPGAQLKCTRRFYCGVPTDSVYVSTAFFAQAMELLKDLPTVLEIKDSLFGFPATKAYRAEAVDFARSLDRASHVRFTNVATDTQKQAADVYIGRDSCGVSTFPLDGCKLPTFFVDTPGESSLLAELYSYKYLATNIQRLTDAFKSPPSPQEIRRKSFQEAFDPGIKWLAENASPHCVVVVENDFATLFEGTMSYPNNKHIKD